MQTLNEDLNLTEEHLDMMKHAWGFSYGKRAGFRTHYCTQLDDPKMLYLQQKGMFGKPVGMGSVGENCGIFHLTDKAIAILKDLKKKKK